jgi:hypothetical protein
MLVRREDATTVVREINSGEIELETGLGISSHFYAFGDDREGFEALEIGQGLRSNAAE